MVNGTETHCVKEQAATSATLSAYWQAIDRGEWRYLVDPEATLGLS
jgi:hypothetical protein